MGSLIRAKELLDQAREAGLEITPRNGKLFIRGPKSLGWIVEEIRKYREEIISIISHVRTMDSPERFNRGGDGTTTSRNQRKTEVLSPAASAIPCKVRGRPSPWTDRDEDLASLILLLSPEDLPPTPFQRAPWGKVLDAAKFLAWLQRDAALGAASPRAFFGALQEDLRSIREIVFRFADETESPNRNPSR